MTQRQTVLLLMIPLLVGVNIWYWWPRAGEISRMESSPGVGRFQIEDFALKIPPGVDDKNTRLHRDLFRPKQVIVAKPVVKEPPKPVEPPPKTPEQLEEEAARAELSQIKLVGVVFRGERGQAYLTRGDQAYMVFAGGKVGERFTVETIATDTVQLKDAKTNVTGRIPISGVSISQ
jgi:hypothetical protein